MTTDKRPKENEDNLIENFITFMAYLIVYGISSISLSLLIFEIGLMNYLGCIFLTIICILFFYLCLIKIKEVLW